MKNMLKGLTLLLLSIILVACNNNNSPEVESVQTTTETTAESVEETQESTEETSVVDNDNADNESEETDQDQTDADDSANENAQETVRVAFYVDGNETAEQEFEVEYTEGMNVLEALESIEDLDFNFNEDEGVVDVINDIENDYYEGRTWAYLLNGEYAELGVISQTLEAGDEIAWYYGTVDQIPMNLVPAE